MHGRGTCAAAGRAHSVVKPIECKCRLAMGSHGVNECPSQFAKVSDAAGSLWRRIQRCLLNWLRYLARFICLAAGSAAGSAVDGKSDVAKSDHALCISSGGSLGLSESISFVRCTTKGRSIPTSRWKTCGSRFRMLLYCVSGTLTSFALE
eukprot:1999377-Pleurochrysis_carterae.AAC.9